MARIKYQEAAGLEVKRGRPPAGPAPTKADLVKLYVREGRSVRAVALALDVDKSRVHRALKEARIKTRPHTRPANLANVGLAAVLNERRPEGPGRPWRQSWRDVARTFNVNPRTLRRFIQAADVRDVTPRALKGAARRAWQLRRKWRL